MSGQEKLQLSVSHSLDPFWKKAAFGAEHESPFQYPGWRTYTNFAMRRRDFAPVNSVSSYGNTSQFRYDKSAFQRGPIQLVIVRSALTPQGTPGTFARFVDWEGYEMIDNIQLVYGSNLLYTLTGEQMLLRHKLDLKWEKSESAKELVFGDKSIADRNTLAGAAQTLYVDVPLPYTLAPGRYFPVTSIAHELEVRVTFRALSKITQTDYTLHPTGTITSCNLRSTDVHVMHDERDYTHKKTISRNGVVYRIIEWENQRETLVAGQTIYNINLSNLKGSAIEYILTLRLASNLSDSLPTTNQTYTNFQDLATWGITSGSTVIIDEKDSRYTRFYLNPLYHSNLMVGDFIFTDSESLDPESLNNALGHKTIASMVVPQLRVTFAGALGANVILDIYARCNNLWSLNGGEIKRVFQ